MFSHWDEDAKDDDYGTSLFKNWGEDEPSEFRPLAHLEDTDNSTID